MATNGTNLDFCEDSQDDFKVTGKYLYITFLTVPVHLCNIVSIITSKRLHQNVYFLLLNLSISDTLCISSFFLLTAGPSVYMPVLRTFYTTSILFTCSMTLDRYLKVCFFFLLIF